MEGLLAQGGSATGTPGVGNSQEASKTLRPAKSHRGKGRAPQGSLLPLGPASCRRRAASWQAGTVTAPGATSAAPGHNISTQSSTPPPPAPHPPHRPLPLCSQIRGPVCGAVAGATAKTLTAPLDRWKLWPLRYAPPSSPTTLHPNFNDLPPHGQLLLQVCPPAPRADALSIS